MRSRKIFIWIAEGAVILYSIILACVAWQRSTAMEDLYRMYRTSMELHEGVWAEYEGIRKFCTPRERMIFDSCFQENLHQMQRGIAFANRTDILFPGYTEGIKAATDCLRSTGKNYLILQMILDRAKSRKSLFYVVQKTPHRSEAFLFARAF